MWATNTAVARIARDAASKHGEKAVLESTGLSRLPDEEMTRPILGKEGLQNRVTQSQNMWMRPNNQVPGQATDQDGWTPEKERRLQELRARRAQ